MGLTDELDFILRQLGEGRHSSSGNEPMEVEGIAKHYMHNAEIILGGSAIPVLQMLSTTISWACDGQVQCS